MLRRFVAAFGFVITAAGCGGGSASVTATEIDGVWVFSGPQPDHAKDGLFSGIPAVVGECLVLGKAIVIWRRSDLDEVATVVGAAKAKTSAEIDVSGGLWEDRKSTELPHLVDAIISDHCLTDEETIVWEAASPPIFD